MRIRRTLYLSAFFVVAGLLAGCGGNLAEVKGTVKYDGKLIEKGYIRFEPTDQKSQPDGADIIAGEYHAKKVPIGAVKVSITGSKYTKKKLYDTPNSPEQDFPEPFVPDKYADHQKSELKYDVAPGVNAKDWDLSK